MIGPAVLVLDEDAAAVFSIDRQDVGGELFHRNLGTFQCQPNPQLTGETVQVVGQPRGKVLRLMRPHFTYVHVNQFTEFHFRAPRDGWWRLCHTPQPGVLSRL